MLNHATNNGSASAGLVAQYETAISEAIGVRHAIAFAYSRTGLATILEAAGLRPGDEIVLSPLTCKVVPLTLLAMSLRPVYADILPHTLNLDPQSVMSSVGASTRAVLFQHTYGNPQGIDAIAEFCRRRGLLLVEDCAQCVPQGADGPGRWGQASIFSNNPRKPVPAGSGGVVATNDGSLADSIRKRRDNLPTQGSFGKFIWAANVSLHDLLVRPPLYWPLFSLARALGSVYQVGALSHEIEAEVTRAAIQPSSFHMRRGLAWLPRIAELAAQRRMCSEDYARRLQDCPDVVPFTTNPHEPLYFFPVVVANKQELLRKARASLLEVVAWPLHLPIYPVERESDLLQYGYTSGSCVVAEEIARRLVGLPTDFGAKESRRTALINLIRSL